MDPSLFQFNATAVFDSPKPGGILQAHASMHFKSRESQWLSRRTRAASLLEIRGTFFGRNRRRESFSTKHAILGLVFFLIATPALGQNAANKGSQSSPQVQSTAEINQRLQQARENIAARATESPISESRIGPDDLLNITVFEAPEMNCSVRVSASGQVSIELLGAVHAAGLTPRELETVLQGLLRQTYMKDPHVGVFVQELQSQGVSVVGAVKMPGIFQIRGTKTVIEVLSMAQGLTDDAGDTVLILHSASYAESPHSPSPDVARGGIGSAPPRRLMLVKSDSPQSQAREKNGEIETINLKKLLESSDSALNVPVRPGDVVKVPRAGIVYVLGEVQKPGGFVLQNNENISVLQALALAEGPTHTSAISRARIIRMDTSTGKRIEIPMNLGKIFSGKAPDTLLQPKDIVFVPNSAAKNVFYKGSQAALQTAAGVAIYRW
jgi:polysaccharide biosynthesis/export protein